MRVILSENIGDIEKWVFPDFNDDNSIEKEKAESLPEEPAEDDHEGDLTSNHITSTIIEPAEDVFLRSEKEGYQRGFEKGLAEGKEQAFKDAELEAKNYYKEFWKERISVVNNFVGQLEKPLEVINDEVQALLGELVLAIAKKLFQSELKQKPEQVIEIIRQAIELLPKNSNNSQIRVNPDDYKLITEVLETNKQQQLVIDDDLNRGEVVCSSEQTFIDGKTSKRMANIAHQVFDNV